MNGSPKRQWVLMGVVIAIVALAAFLRFWELDAFPPGLYPDEAIKGNEAARAAASLDFRIFYPDNNGREGLFINGIAVVFWLFGVGIWQLRFLSALVGTATVLGIYLLGKELFREEQDGIVLGKVRIATYELIALGAAFFVATSFWHLNFSRIPFRAIMVPFLLSFALMFLLRAMRSKGKLNWIFAGIFFGLGFHTYIAFRVAPLIIGTLFAAELLRYFKNRAIASRGAFPTSGWILFMCAAFIVALPMVFYFVNHPQDFMSRSTGISIFATEAPVAEGLRSLWKTLGMFHIRGDENWRHNLSGAPELFFPVGILFLIGFGVTFRKMAFGIKNALFSKGNEVPFSLTSSTLLMSWFFVMLLPAVLTAEGLPHALRSIGAIPPSYLLAAVGFSYVCKWFSTKFAKTFITTRLTVLGAGLFFLILTVSSYRAYFVIWGNHPDTAGAFTRYFVDIGKLLNSFPENTHRFVIVNENGVPVNGIPMPAQTVMFITGRDESIAYLLPQNIPHTNFQTPAVIIPMRMDDGLRDTLSSYLPGIEETMQGGVHFFRYK